MNVEILSIGTELLLGEIVDTNSAYIARQLRDIGVNIFYLTTVGDNLERITGAIRASLARADVVVTTGGLGPTVDDMTRQAVALATNRELEFRPELLDQIAERFRQLGTQMSENNRMQAYIPAGSIPVHNRLGTAPCFIVETEQGTVISLPGVPREMKDILETTIIPYLRERMGGMGIIKAQVLKTAGISESQIDARIADLMTWTNPTVGLAAHTGQTDIRITARADTEAEADRMIAEAEAIVRERVGEYIFGTGQQSLDEVFLGVLREKGWKLAVSYTGPDGEAFVQRLGQLDGAICDTCDDDLPGLLARLGEDPAKAEDAASLDFCQLSRAEAKRLVRDTQANVAIAIVTFDSGTGITALTELEERSRCYGFGGRDSDAPNWAGTWGMAMAWQLARQVVAS
jgi:competence/damage-inducible protein CinA-like protein